MPLTGSPISEVIERGQREVDDGTVKIEAKIAANIDDKTIERGIVRALDAAGAP
jgi:uncharacterized linocin/CFP29 family protein